MSIRLGKTQAKMNDAETTGREPSHSSPTIPKTPAITAEIEDSNSSSRSWKGSRTSVLTGTTALPSPAPPPRRVPLTISHRGTRFTHPENSLPAFRSALAISNTAALETDIHLTSDSHVLLSHDPTLQRCFGVNKRVKDCTLEYIKTLRTLTDPTVDCATLSELLSLLTEKEVEERGVWALLDIKVSSGPPQQVITAVKKTLEKFGGGAAAGYGLEYWRGRIKLGVWGYSYVPYCHHLLAGFAVIHIGIDVSYARMFWERGVEEFSLLEAVWMGRKGQKFMADVRKRGGIMCSWTVNDEESMRWCIQQGLDGVVTDQAALFGQICEEYVESPRTNKNYGKLGWGKRFENAAVRALAKMVSWLWRYGSRRGVMWVGDEALKELTKPLRGDGREVVEEGRELLGEQERK